MNLTFTEFVRGLRPDRDPDAEAFEKAWGKLRDALVNEVRKRGLWAAAPSYLGVTGWRCWSEEGALDELLSECYTYVFLDRLASLRAQLEVKDNIEGLVFRSVRNFLYDVQKSNDPLGFRTFTVLRKAVGSLIEAGELHVLGGDPKVLNDTALGLPPAPGEPDPAQGRRLEELVPVWCNDLLPDLVTARGKALEAVVQRLAGLVAELRAQGIGSFWFEDLAQPLKHEVRARWSARGFETGGTKGLESSGPGEARLVEIVDPDRRVEERDAFDKLTAKVSAELSSEAESARTRDYLFRLWGYLRVHARDGQLLSRRKIAERLDIPRCRLTDLFDLLGRRVELCQKSLAG